MPNQRRSAGVLADAPGNWGQCQDDASRADVLVQPAKRRRFVGRGIVVLRIGCAEERPPRMGQAADIANSQQNGDHGNEQSAVETS